MTQKSCTNCVHRLTEDEGAEFWSKSLGAPACSLKELMLAKPGTALSQQEMLAVRFAENCDSHSTSVAVKIGSPPRREDAFTVTAPDPAVVLGGFSDPDDRPTSCNGCIHFVDPRTVKQELKWNAGLCSATGRLILANRYSIEARNCEMGVKGVPRDTTTGLHEVPLYRDGFQPLLVTGAGIGGYQPPTPGQFVEPREYQTDRPLTDEEQDYSNDDGVPFILAIRRFYNPEGTGQFVETYVWNREAFVPEEQILIPQTGDDNHPEWYIDHDGLVYKIMLNWLGVDKTPFLWGHAGVGKTEVLYHIGWMLQIPTEVVAIRPDTQIEEVAGEPQFSVPPWKSGQADAVPETWFREGVIPRRWQRVGILGADEYNMGPHDVSAFMRPMTDARKEIRVNDRLIKRDPFCFLAITANPAWAPQYSGTRELSTADGSRINHIFVGNLPEHLERGVIVQACQQNNPPYNPPSDLIDRIMSIAKQIRAMVEDGSLPIPWGTREQIKVAQLTQFLSLTAAFRMAVVDGMEPDTGQLIMDQVDQFKV